MRRVILAGLTLVLAACQDALPTAPVAAEAEPLAGYGAPVDKTVQQVPVSLVTTGPCLLETLVVQGTLHVTTTVWAAGDRLRIKSHLNGNLAAVGLTTGLPYRYQQVTNTDLELDTSTGASESDQVFLFRVLS
ncbi:MAG TPA: hypothetical protein VFV33_20985, partial [Gemmatimonadaceae bacterium]|nr:hypothetical protein [Gemmatimonadaceae bacterium]